MAVTFVLASSSPRRRDLLTAAGYHFEVESPDIAEVSFEWLSARENTLWNATRKALAVARLRRDAVVLGADTLVWLDGRIIGKPEDLAAAAAILKQLSGRTHVVVSAVAICHFATRRRRTFTETTAVRFKRLNDREIARYHRTINPLDKAGAYAAQGEGKAIIAGMQGSFTNVVGLPMERTTDLLADFGVRPG